MERRRNEERRVIDMPNWRPVPYSTMSASDDEVRPAPADRRTGKDRRSVQRIADTLRALQPD